ncbi:hypothetical protein FOE67_12715 [Streptomyces calidiresistens]|uniref:Uncharacterized protein n=1 Tax=Streptomyces calidiresistens TaxID=1485586 RepID=A0A7W3T3N6_9ACTN|nr:hypothetical protein [Streptomyces calidiresistens]
MGVRAFDQHGGESPRPAPGPVRRRLSGRRRCRRPGGPSGRPPTRGGPPPA